MKTLKGSTPFNYRIEFTQRELDLIKLALSMYDEARQEDPDYYNYVSSNLEYASDALKTVPEQKFMAEHPECLRRSVEYYEGCAQACRDQFKEDSSLEQAYRELAEERRQWLTRAVRKPHGNRDVSAQRGTTVQYRPKITRQSPKNHTKIVRQP